MPRIKKVRMNIITYKECFRQAVLSEDGPAQLPAADGDRDAGELYQLQLSQEPPPAAGGQDQGGGGGGPEEPTSAHAGRTQSLP